MKAIREVEPGDKVYTYHDAGIKVDVVILTVVKRTDKGIKFTVDNATLPSEVDRVFWRCFTWFAGVWNYET